MRLMKVRPTAATVSLIAFYFEQLVRAAIKVIYVARVTYGGSGLKMNLPADKNHTFRPEVHYRFYRYGRLHRLTEFRSTGGGHAG